MRVQFPKSVEPFFQPFRYKVLYGGRGAGRSWNIARALLLMASNQKLRILCTREYQKSIKDSVLRLLQDQVEALGLADDFEITRNEVRHRNESLFIFDGLATNPTKIKSMEGIDICWVEEAERVSQESWDILIPTIRKEGSEIWVSFNPNKETDPTYQMFAVNPPPDSYIRHTTWEDNPWFPVPLRLEKDNLYRNDPARARHIWGGACRRDTEAQVLIGKWIISDFEPGDNWDGPYFGADFGFAEDPSAGVKFYIHQNKMYIEEEVCGYGVEVDDLAVFFNQINGFKEGPSFGDCSRPETISHLRRKGFNISSAKKWAGSVQDGINWLRSLDGIIISPSCKNAIKEAEEWSFKVDRLTNQVKPDLKPGFDHIWDAVRYGANGLIKKEDFIFEYDY